MENVTENEGLKDGVKYVNKDNSYDVIYGGNIILCCVVLCCVVLC